MKNINNDPGRCAAKAIAIAATAPSAMCALFAAIIESCSEAIVSTTRRGLITSWNPAAERLMGYSASEVLGKPSDFIGQPDDRQKVRAAFGRHGRGDKTFRIETTQIRKDGVEIQVSVAVSLLLDRSDKVVGLTAVIRDITAEKLAQRKLVQSEEKFRNIFKYSTEGISIGSLETGKYLDVNDEFLRVSRFPREQVIGKDAVELGIFSKKDFTKLGEDVLADGIVRNRELVLTHADGTPYVSLISAVIVEMDGTRCALGIAKDITELKRAQEDLLRTERQLNDVLANAPLAVLAIDRDGIITSARGRSVKAAGYSPEQLIGKSVEDLFAPSNSVLGNIRRALTGETFNAIERINAGQMLFETWYSPVWNSSHEVTGTISVWTDITAREKAQDELRRSEKYYRSLVENSSDATIITDEASTIVFAAGEGCKGLGYEVAELVGKNGIEFVHPDDVATQAAINERCFADPGYVSRSETPIRCKDGSWRECEFIDRVTTGLNGRPFLVSNVRDISERKRVEAEIAKSRDQALAASRAKSEFLSSMSHEIRTPMNAILGMADLMWETGLTPEQRRYLGTIINNGNALLELINSILDLARVESGRLSLEQVDFDLRELLEKVADTLAVRADEKRIELTSRIDQDVPVALVGDPLRLRQVLTNLIGNAIKFTARGGVVVHVKRDDAGQAGCALHFSVTDSGIGIPADKLDTLFKPFTQADSSVTRKFGGTGLGLAIVDRLVGLMGGKVGVQSESGRGSTFSFTAEFQEQTAPAANDHPQTEAIDLTAVKVLVVDDNEVNRVILREMLTPRGATVVEAASGSEGIDLFRRARESKQPFRLLISDHVMPGMDGFEMIQRIREISSEKELAIMMLSSVDLAGNLARVRRMGIECYIVKPIKRGELYGAIARAGP